MAASKQDDFKAVYASYTECKTARDREKYVWDDIAKYTGISVDPNNMWTGGNGAKDLDDYVDDPTSAIAVNQAGDYMLGIMWGTGEKALSVVPSRHLLEMQDMKILAPYFDYVTEQVLYHMNHADAGLNTSLKPYAYDQFSFGTSGIGVFPNKSFLNGVSHNALVFRGYGIDNIAIDEGKSGLVEINFVSYRWRVNEIIGEFCGMAGTVDNKRLSQMPKPIQDAYKKHDLNKEFGIVFGMLPRDDFDPKLKGKRGARYRGVWFMDEGNDNKFFHEEDFKERPISICRQVKIRGKRYGRSSGTMLISTIRATNFMLGNSMEIMEKMCDPALGMWGAGAIGDAVLDSSPRGLTIFNSTFTGKDPVFQLHDVGDPADLVKFLLPYLNEKLTTGFKVDALLDFSSAKEMTATESLQRYAIRGKSLAGMLIQQKVELLDPMCRRVVSLLFDMKELGVNPLTDPQRATDLAKDKKRGIGRVIPKEVLDLIDKGKPWFEIKFNNELEKLTKTQAVQDLVQVIQAITAIAALYPQIVQAVDWFKLLEDINNNLDRNNQILCSATEFADKIAAMAQQQAAAAAIQAGEAGANINSLNSQANKNNQQAAAAKNGL